MITKVLKAPAKAAGGPATYGCDVGGLLRYLYGRGKANEHDNPHLVAGWSPDDLVGLEPELFVHSDGGRSVSVSALAGRLTDPLAWAGVSMSDPHVYHVTLSTGPNDRLLSDAEWARVAEDMMDRVGIAPAGDPHGCRWVAVRHGLSKEGNDHIHIAATLVRQDGRIPNIRGDFMALRAGALEWEQRLGLTVTPAAGQASSLTQPAQGERPKARRMSGADLDADGVAVAATVRAAAAKAHTDKEFFALLEANGLVVHAARERGSGAIRGYAVSSDTGRWTGSELHGQSLPRLRRMWASSPALGAADKAAYLSPPASEDTRTYLSRAVRVAANESANDEQFFARLRDGGLVVKVRMSTTNPDQVTGYSVGFRGQADADGNAITYSGSSLSGQSLPRLRQGWDALPRVGPPAEQMDTDTMLGKFAMGGQFLASDSFPADAEATAAAAGVALSSLASGAEGVAGGPLTTIAERFTHSADPVMAPQFGAGSNGLLQAARALHVLKGAAGDRTQQQIVDILVAAMQLAAALEQRRERQGLISQQASAAGTRALIGEHLAVLGHQPVPPTPATTTAPTWLDDAVRAAGNQKPLGNEGYTANTGHEPKGRGR
ncbi:MAG: hypothetical protein WA988_12970 [Candidatus Nanopelagicales bacterium]|nr:hypothetical protein [Actinomycetota bacterium]